MLIAIVINARPDDKAGCQALARSSGDPYLKAGEAEWIFKCTNSSGRNHDKHLGSEI